MYRLLMNATAEGGAGAETPPAPPTPPVKPAEAEKPAPLQVDPAHYARTFQELEELRRYKATADAERQAALDAERQKSLQATAEKDGIVAALKEQERQLKEREEAERKRANDLESDWLAEKKENVLASALAGRTFASAAAQQQVLALLAARFGVARENGQVHIRDRDGRFAAETIPTLLDSAEFAHFIAPTSRGGAGAAGGDRSAADEKPTQPRNIGEAAILAIKEAKARGEKLPRYFGVR